jgi:surface antigen
MMREPVQQTYNPAFEPDKKKPALETGQQTPNPQTPTEPSKLENPSAAQYEVLLEQMAHDMGYENKLTSDQQALLAKFGYSDGGMVDGPFGFEMRSFIPSNPEYPHPILAFRGAEFTKIKDLVASLEPQSVGLQQFNANRRRIELELQKLSKHGKVWLTGHSLGGALAQLAGSEFADLTGRIITFQSPGIDAKHVNQLKKHNKANEDQKVVSTHYQVAGDVVSGAGEALTPGELIKFEMNPSSGASMKHYGIGLIAGAIVGPGTGVVVKEASEKVSKHRAFPVSNVIQENLAFQDLFENGKKFDKVAGISDDTFQARATLNSDTFQNTRVSEFLRHTIGKTSFEIENAASNWGGDAKARDFAESNKKTIGNYTATELLEHLNRLLDGWVSDDDVQAFETICHGVRDPKIMNEIRNSISPRLEELHSEHQRKWIEDAINFKPIPEDKTVQRDAIGTISSKPQIQNLTGGNTLDSTQRKELEEHFNVNLENVRIHSDENALKTAKDLNAKAATIGENIILGEGASTTDKELMGHEIAHVIQQREGRVSTGIDPDQKLEADAQLEGKNFAAGTKVRGKRAMLEVKKPSADTVQRKETPKTPVTIIFSGQSAKEATFKPYTRGVLEDIMRKAGISSCTITSTTRTPHDQARIFYMQLTGQLGSAAYAAPGEAVKAVGRKAIDSGKTRDEAIAAMEAKIRTFDPLSKVSKHLADPDVLNVFDVAPNSVSSGKQQAFIDAVLAESRVSKFLYPGNSDDPAYHIEVPQTAAAPTPTPTVGPTPEVKTTSSESIQRKEDTKTSGASPTPAVKSPTATAQTPPQTPSNSSDWNNRPFSANLMGSEDNRRIDFTLDRNANKITGSFAIHGTGRGNITKGEFNPADKTSPLHLEVVFTDGELKGKTRILDGWFLYAENGSKKDENNDGKDDSSKTALPLLIGGVWKGGNKEYKLEPITPQATVAGGKNVGSDDKALEKAIAEALPKAMAKTSTPKSIERSDARANVPLILAECKRAGITDPKSIAYIMVTAAWESSMGGDMEEYGPKNADPVAYFNNKYANRLGNGDAASNDGYNYRGRGFVQLTGRSLYARATKGCKDLDFKIDGNHPDLVKNPELVATNKPLAALILVFGMKEGWFTGVGLDKHTKGHTKDEMYPEGQLDPNEARWIVNGNDTNSKAPMKTATESLSSTIQGVPKAGDGKNTLQDITGDDYTKLREVETGGYDAAERKKIMAGIETGSLDGVPGYYNGTDYSQTWASHISKDGFYYGEKWQCVEYVRRYYHDALSTNITHKGDAKTWFTDGLKDGVATFDGLNQYSYSSKATKSKDDDGFSVKPQKGDILVLQVGGYGHVAIVAEVSDTNVKIAQQNVYSDGFTSDFGIKKLSTGEWQFKTGSPLALLRKS